MDGNGRWAQARGKERVAGHREGAESVRACVEAAMENGVKYLSLFAFSEENWGRPESEVSFLMGMMAHLVVKELKAFLENGIRFLVLGNRSRLSSELNATIDDVIEKTAGNDHLTLILFLSYSGKWDIVQAVNKLLASKPAGEISAADIDANLVTAGIPDPDLLIRTSGELRVSNYLLWQTAYTEFYFTDMLWPDFRKKEFAAALQEYARRDRRFGKVK